MFVFGFQKAPFSYKIVSFFSRKLNYLHDIWHCVLVYTMCVFIWFNTSMCFVTTKIACFYVEKKFVYVEDTVVV